MNARLLARISVVTVALGASVALAAPRQDAVGAPTTNAPRAKQPAAAAPGAGRRPDPTKEMPVVSEEPERQLLKQPPMPMRRMTQAQRAAAAAKLKTLREEDARRSGHAVPAARPMPQPQLLPLNRVDQ
jgi:hypothetical protein